MIVVLSIILHDVLQPVCGEIHHLYNRIRYYRESFLMPYQPVLFTLLGDTHAHVPYTVYISNGKLNVFL